MSVDPTLVQWILGLIGTGTLTGLGFVLRTLGNQNKALAVLVERVGTSNVSTLEARISGCEADLSRIWGIYDAWKSSSATPAFGGFNEHQSVPVHSEVHRNTGIYPGNAHG